jgi:hypothetical protein
MSLLRTKDVEEIGVLPKAVVHVVLQGNAEARLFHGLLEVLLQGGFVDGL